MLIIFLVKGLAGVDKKQVEEILRNYNWMINEIQRQRTLLLDIGTNLVAQSGIESTMPKAQGDPGDPVGREVIRREKKSSWVEKLEKKVTYIQERMYVIEDEREKLVLECLLDGLSMTAIGKHTGLSRRHVHNIRSKVVGKIAEAEPCNISHFAHFAHKMTKEKCLV